MPRMLKCVSKKRKGNKCSALLPLPSPPQTTASNKGTPRKTPGNTGGTEEGCQQGELKGSWRGHQNDDVDLNFLKEISKSVSFKGPGTQFKGVDKV